MTTSNFSGVGAGAALYCNQTLSASEALLHPKLSFYSRALSLFGLVSCRCAALARRDAL